MSSAPVMAELKKLGKPNTAKIYRRHGAGDDVFGVSFADLGKLAKRLKVDHALAMDLWATGNADARVLALMVADPLALNTKQADAWVKDARYSLHAEYLARVVAESTICAGRMAKWMTSKHELVKACGYAILSHVLKDAPDTVTDAECRRMLAVIAKEIHGSPNRAKSAMNMALIAIGIYKPSLRDGAIRMARSIGHVEIDHGDTGCKTPDAEPYILNAAKRVKANKS